MRARALAVILAVMLPACVLQERFRYVQKQDHCFVPPPDPVPGVPNERRPYPSIDCPSSKFKAAFIEFDEDGEHIDAVQAEKALALIRSEKARRGNGKVITLVYVHGWKNNADQAAAGRKHKDVERFSGALAELGERAAQASPGNAVPVVGVYIGWRGKSLKGPGLFTWLSYWSRRNVGNNVGRQPLTDVLNSVIDTTVPPNSNDPSRVMLVGHSFGARVLEHAIEKGVTLYDPERRADAVPVRPRVDLVLYVNAAIDARLSLGRVQQLRTAPITVRHPNYDPARCPSSDVHDPICKQYPLLVAITSRGDLATKYLQPIANRLNLDESGTKPTLPTGTFLEDIPSAGRITRSAPGHLRFIHSHDVSEVDCPSTPGTPPVCEAADLSCAFAFRTRGDCDACFKTSARAKAGPRAVFNDTAFWIMDIDKRVIKDHGDIWNLSTLSMLGQLMAPRGFFHPEISRMRIVAGE